MNVSSCRKFPCVKNMSRADVSCFTVPGTSSRLHNTPECNAFTAFSAVCIPCLYLFSTSSTQDGRMSLRSVAGADFEFLRGERWVISKLQLWVKMLRHIQRMWEAFSSLSASGGKSKPQGDAKPTRVPRSSIRPTFDRERYLLSSHAYNVCLFYYHQ